MIFGQPESLTGENWIKSNHKRRQDVALAIASLPLTLPLTLGAAGAVRWIDRMSPVFRQNRLGLAGNTFTIFKLSTLGQIDHEGTRSGGYNDSRATRLGRVLRVVGGDELPQIYNVLKGDMSLVGPRPLVKSDVQHMEETLSPSEFSEWYRAYTACRPGIISNYSVLTHRPDPLIPNTYHNRAASDVEYYELASMERDYQVMFDAIKLAPTLLREAAVGIVHP